MLFLHHQPDIDGWLPVQFLVLQAYLADKGYEVVPAHAEFLVLGLGLSELQYLVDEVQQSDGALVNDGYLLCVLGG